jgi:Domain of unknown function (DUF4280)
MVGLRRFGRTVREQAVKPGGKMAVQVVMGAMLQCSFGAAPSSMVVLPTNQTMAGGVPAATIMDNAPLMNIMPFGTCSSPANPTVAAATAAALGVLTPMPCIPATAAPWAPGAPTVTIGGMPALDNSCKLMCNWAGVIQVTNPGQTSVMVP